MEVFLSFLQSIDFSALFLSISSSGALGAWLGYKVEKKKAGKELELQKQNYESTIKQMEKEHELNIRQKQLEWEHEKQVLEETLNRDRIERLQASYNSMISAVTDYMNLSTPNSKSLAESEIRKFAVVADSALYTLIDELDDAVSVSDPFEGPSKKYVKTIISKIRVDLLK